MGFIKESFLKRLVDLFVDWDKPENPIAAQVTKRMEEMRMFGDEVDIDEGLSQTRAKIGEAIGRIFKTQGVFSSNAHVQAMFPHTC